MKISKKDILSEATTIASAMDGYNTNNPNAGFFLGPLGKVPQNIIRRRIYFPGGKKNLVEPPQGYVNEHLYSTDGKVLNEADLNDLFGNALTKQKPSFSSNGRMVMYEPKCMAFPYCSQGAVDKPVKLIGESKQEMCESCFEYINTIAEAVNKKPKTIARMIREFVLREEHVDIPMYNLSEENGRLIAEDGNPAFAEDIKFKTIEEAQKYLDNNKISGIVEGIYNKNNNEKTDITEMTNNHEEKDHGKRMLARRKMLEALSMDENLKECMYEVMSMEGFAPIKEDLNEGENWESTMNTMMEDDQMCEEAYNAIMMNESECAGKMKTWMNETYANMMKQPGYMDVGMNEVEGIDTPTPVATTEKGVETLGLVKDKLPGVKDYLLKDFIYAEKLYKKVAIILKQAEPFFQEHTASEFTLDKMPEETYREFFQRVINNPEFRPFYSDWIIGNIGDKYGDINKEGESQIEELRLDLLEILGDRGLNQLETKLKRLEQVFDDKGSLKGVKQSSDDEENDGVNLKVSTDDGGEEDSGMDDDTIDKSFSAKKVKAPALDFPDDEDDLDEGSELRMRAGANGKIFENESKLPVKGNNVDSENAKNSKDSTSADIKAAEKTQKTVEQKVDNLKNQKYELNEKETTVAEKVHGMNNALDYNYVNGLTKDQKDKIEMEVTTGHSRERDKAAGPEANVNTESTAGEGLINSAKSRNTERDENYTSLRDRTYVEKEEEHTKSTAVNEDINYMKHLFAYKEKLVTENKRSKVDENSTFLDILNKSRKK
jgi:hypothetical protein